MMFSQVVQHAASFVRGQLVGFGDKHRCHLSAVHIDVGLKLKDVLLVVC